MGSSLESSAFQLTIPSFPGGVIFGNQSEPVNFIYETSTSQEYRLGTKLYDINTDRVFRYARNGGTALVAAYMTSAEAQTAAGVNEVQTTYGTSANVGDVEIDIDVTTGTTWTEDDYADGWLHVNDATAEGDIYRILANRIYSGDDTRMRVRLETGIRTAWDATTEITIMKNKYNDVVVAPTTAAGVPTGVPLVAVVANSFFWAQTGGYCPMFVDTGDTIVIGEPAGKPGTNAVAGAVGLVANDGTDVVYGSVVYESTAGEVALIDLTLDS
jgi:hypothetical protein